MYLPASEVFGLGRSKVGIVCDGNIVCSVFRGFVSVIVGSCADLDGLILMLVSGDRCNGCGWVNVYFGRFGVWRMVSGGVCDSLVWIF